MDALLLVKNLDKSLDNGTPVAENSFVAAAHAHCESCEIERCGIEHKVRSFHYFVHGFEDVYVGQRRGTCRL